MRKTKKTKGKVHKMMKYNRGQGDKNERWKSGEGELKKTEYAGARREGNTWKMRLLYSQTRGISYRCPLTKLSGILGTGGGCDGVLSSSSSSSIISSRSSGCLSFGLVLAYIGIQSVDRDLPQ